MHMPSAVAVPLCRVLPGTGGVAHHWGGMTVEARELLLTRGITAYRAAGEYAEADGVIHWEHDDLSSIDSDDVTWYVDASLIDAKLGHLARLGVAMIGVGIVTISGDTGVYINGISAGSGALAQYGACDLVKLATDTWLAVGLTVA